MHIVRKAFAQVIAFWRTFSEGRRFWNLILQVGKYAILIWLAIFTGVPLFWVLLTSVKERHEVFATFLPRTIDFSNYVRVWNGENMSQHFLNSLFVTGLTV